MFHPFQLLINGQFWITVLSNLKFSFIQWSGRFLGIIGWDPSVCKSNRLYVDILRFSFIKWRYFLQIPLKWSIIFMQSWTSTGYFSNSTGSFATNCWFSPIMGFIGSQRLFLCCLPPSEKAHTCLWIYDHLIICVRDQKYVKVLQLLCKLCMHKFPIQPLTIIK